MKAIVTRLFMFSCFWILASPQLFAAEAGTPAQLAAQIAQAGSVRTMNLTGEVAKAEQGYIIRTKRGNVPSQIYTILNPDPKVLDELVKSGRTVPLEVRIVSGDNVEIEKIGGKPYKAAQAPKAGANQPAASAAKPIVLTITGKIVKGDQGYTIQGQKPPELFTVLNPNPSVLDTLVKSGKTVTIEAVSVMGDNVNIQKIDGKPYKEAKGK